MNAGKQSTRKRRKSIFIYFSAYLFVFMFLPFQTLAVKSHIVIISTFFSYILVYSKHYGAGTLLKSLTENRKDIIYNIILLTTLLLISALLIDSRISVALSLILYALALRISKEREALKGMITFASIIVILLMINIRGIQSLVLTISHHIPFFIAILLTFVFFELVMLTSYSVAKVEIALGEYPAELIMLRRGRCDFRAKLTLSRIRAIALFGRMLNGKKGKDLRVISPFRKLNSADVRKLKNAGIESILVQRKIIPSEFTLYFIILSSMFAIVLALAG